MHAIVIAGYLTAAVAFLVGTLLLSVSWRGQRTGALLLMAMLVTTLWGGLLAYAEWQRTALAVNWILLVDVVRYGAWLTFVGALFGAWPMPRLLRGGRVAVHVLWLALALYCLWPATGLTRVLTMPWSINATMIGVLILALAGVVFLEQIYRNVKPEQRWALKFLVIALGAVFAYDIFLYSYAVLYRQFNISAWAARGFIDALLVPLLLVAAARNPRWSLDVSVSRHAVFYSTSLLVVAFYITATAIGGYYVRLYGGNWGRVAEITLVCLALVSLLLISFSGQARSRLRVFLHKNFFSFRHDYREEWLRLTATLSSTDTDLPQRAVRAMAQIMDSPAGALFLRGDTDEFAAEARWNLPTPADLKLSANLPTFELMRTRRWIYDLQAAPPLGNTRLQAPAELRNLPHAWLAVPMVREAHLLGFVVLAHARARRALDWEDIDLLRAAGSQVAGSLAQADDARRLAEARQFEGFNRLTAFLMHDLKNLAAQQSLLLQNAERHKHNPAFVDDMLATVANSVQRVSHLLEQLRGEAAPVKHSRVRLATVLARALDECHAQLPKPDYQPVTDAVWLHADTEQLATVLGHVIRNAQDAAQPQGHVTLQVILESGCAVIEIKDDGAGMDEAFIRNQLFKPFFTTKASKGMGIGAYQARAYVHSLGGSMRVTSTPGQGSVFAIRLPVAEPIGDTTATDLQQASP